MILDKGIDPNSLQIKYLINYKNKYAVLDFCPISFACMKYQNNAINFIMKFNNTIREILKIQKKV